MSLGLVGQLELFSFTTSPPLFSFDFKSVTWVPPDPLKTSRGGGQVIVLNVIPILTKIIMITIFFFALVELALIVSALSHSV